jgi:(E)-4-hydroxy-3-methylbut-2-enyl-diphosphate synthase
MTRYGNTPAGMVASAMEFIRIFRAENFNDLVLSMKSSDTVVLLESNRLLVADMQKEGVAFPIHLGVTEAGEGEEGSIRSAAGIGALLSEGIGDTIRVSLTGDPEQEIPVAREILRFIGGESGRPVVSAPYLGFRSAEALYRPEVVTCEHGNLISENGTPLSGEVITFNASNPPLFTDDLKTGVVLNPIFDEDDPAKLAIVSAALLGRYFILKQAGGICITNRGKVQGEKLKEISFAILQATEARITRNRYISCPTCGRTKFNLQEAVQKVKAATSHISGLKIAVMGCIVNGPGEMAGADYGYVGAAEGKVHIYRGMVPVMKNVPEKEAVEELLKIIYADTGKGSA